MLPVAHLFKRKALRTELKALSPQHFVLSPVFSIVVFLEIFDHHFA